MATLNEIVSILSERVSRTFDVPFQEELKVLVKLKAIRYTKDLLTKKPLDRRYFLQSFVAKIIQIPEIECPIKYGCTLRTELKIPRPIRANNTIFDFVGTPDFVEIYGIGGEWKENFFKHNKYTSKKVRYLYKNDFIYIKDNDNTIEYIGIQGIFEDFEKLAQFKCNEIDVCNTDNQEFPIDSSIVSIIITDLLANELRLMPINDNSEVQINGTTK